MPKGTRGGSKSSGGTIRFSDYSEFYQNRLKSIGSEIRSKQITASLVHSDSASVRRKANNAIRRIEQLDKQYELIEKQAVDDVKQRRRMRP